MTRPAQAMSRPHRFRRETTPRIEPVAPQPTPPMRRPLFLLATAVATALWLAFLLWMAMRPEH